MIEESSIRQHLKSVRRRLGPCHLTICARMLLRLKKHSMNIILILLKFLTYSLDPKKNANLVFYQKLILYMISDNPCLFYTLDIGTPN